MFSWLFALARGLAARAFRRSRGVKGISPFRRRSRWSGRRRTPERGAYMRSPTSSRCVQNRRPGVPIRRGGCVGVVGPDGAILSARAARNLNRRAVGQPPEGTISVSGC